MGQKVNPHGLRVGIMLESTSRSPCMQLVFPESE